MPVVTMPDGVNVSFPDNMAPQAIRSLILRKFPNAADLAKQPAPARPDFAEANTGNDGAPADLVDALRSRTAAPASYRGDFQPLAAGADLHGQTPEDQLVEYGKPSALVSGLMGAADTASVGTVDEISAALRSAVKGESYDEALARSRAKLRTAQIEHPDAYLAGEIGGGLASAAVVPGSGILKGTSTLAKVGRGALAGAGFGAAQGFGGGEGGLENRLDSALEGAAGGALVGGVIPAAAETAKFIGKPIVNAVKARINPAGYAGQKVVQRLEAANLTPDLAAHKISQAAASGQSMRLADVGGDSARDLLRTAANVPGAGRTTITARANLGALGQGDRLKRIIGDAFQTNPEEAYQAAKITVMDARSNAATPYYNQAWKVPVPYTKGLEELLNTPAGKVALASAKTNTLNRREPWAQWFASIDDNGNITDTRRVPDSRALDEVKRALDRMVEEAKAPADGSPFVKAKATPRSIAIQTVRDDLSSFLKEHNPPYRKAVEVGLDNIQADEALEFGRNALRMDPRVIARKMGEAGSYGRDTVFGEGQKELARIGLVENLRDVVDSSGFTHNAIHKFFSSSEQIRRIRPFFRSKGDFQQFRAAIFNEVRKRKTYDAVRSNSTTARQIADMQDADGLAETAGTVATAARGGVIEAALSTLQRGLRRLGGLTPKTANEIGKLLMTADPEKVRGILNTLRRIEASSARADQKSAAIQGLLSRFAASEVGRALAPEPTPQMAVQYR